MRSLGIRFKIFDEEGFPASSAVGKVDVYDIASGESIANVANVKLSYSPDGPIEATIIFYPTAQEIFD